MLLSGFDDGNKTPPGPFRKRNLCCRVAPDTGSADGKSLWEGPKMQTWLSTGGAKVLWRLLLAIALVGGVPAGDGFISELAGSKAAFADDDDDDDDAGSSAGSGSRGGDRLAGPRRALGGNFLRGLQKRLAPRQQRRATVRRPSPPPALSTRSTDEIVAVGLTVDEADALPAAGFIVIERASLQFANSEIVKLRTPPATTIDATRDRLRAVAPGADVDFNHYFRPGQDSVDCDANHCVAPNLVGWPLVGAMPASCGGAMEIGLIDTAINPDHAALAGDRIEVIRLSGGDLPESGRQHGTAIAALLVGSAGSAAPGLLPAAKLVAVDAFHRGARQDDRSEAYDLVRAIDLLAGRKVDVINMSLSGPANTVLERLVRKAGSEVVLVAAAGNQGPKAEPVYPAAYAEVFAVTAVDRRKQAYRRAGRGEHIDLAAPGVEVWTAASISGGRPKTGTSFAAPFVTAAAALAKSSGMNAVSDIHEALTSAAEDLGDPGKDPVFGWGLLNARALCETPAPRP
jgi:subtilisin family serine protease